jgi:hypothetical protein
MFEGRPDLIGKIIIYESDKGAGITVDGGSQSTMLVPGGKTWRDSPLNVS